MDLPEQAPATRRGFLGRACAACGCAACAFVAVSVLRYLTPAHGSRPSGPIPVCKEEDVAEGAAKAIPEYRLLLVKLDGKLRAVDRKCTHAGCFVLWEPGSRIFRCPCHGARFAPEGRLLAGPAEKDLSSFPVSVRDGRVIVKF